MEHYILFKEAAERLGISRGTLHYHLVHLRIERHKFPLDRHAYIKLDDFERLRRYKEEAQERQADTSPRLPIVEKEPSHDTL